MKQKKYLFIAAAAALFAACSSDDATTEQVKRQAPQEVSFDAYVNRGVTRAGTAGELNLDNIKYDAYTFGVLGYYTDNQPYSPTSTPNFMYNQQVVYSTGKWVYAPVKYWPNEFGTGADSDGADKLSFFAYAPYVVVKPETGRVTGDETSGIVGLTSNSTAGDPYVKYYVDFNPAKSVDLCWGVSDGAFTSTVTGPTTPDKNNIADGAPFIDVIKPQVADAGRLKFNFQHALSKLNVQIDADVDEATVSATHPALAAGTKIYVRSITFEGIALKGLLNLNSSKLEISGGSITGGTGPQWYELSSTNTRISSSSVTIYDGRRNGKEGQANADAVNEKPCDLNSAIIQKDTNTDGVTNSPVNLFGNGALEAPVYVIPGTDPLQVTIVYDVETVDTNVAGYLSDGKTHGSTIENKITKQLFPVALIPGYAYTVKLHLGMTSVQFDAKVTPWTVSAQTQDHTLPNNN